MRDVQTWYTVVGFGCNQPLRLDRFDLLIKVKLHYMKNTTAP